jgi:hypothetical protein
MALALCLRDTYLTALADRPPCRAEIVVNNALRAGVPPAQSALSSFQVALASGGNVQQRSMLWRT